MLGVLDGIEHGLALTGVSLHAAMLLQMQSR